jgi:uncharacterized protein (TIGR00369 family)
MIETVAIGTTERTRTVAWHDPAEVATRGRELAGIDYLRAIASGELPPPPIGLLIGMAPVSVEPGRVAFELEPGEHLYNPIGLVHGGALATLLDSVAGCAVHSTLPAGVGYATTSLSLSFVRAVRADAGTITATGEVVHVGRTVAHATATALDAGSRVLATAQVTCAVIR